jgi:hypothetical protein
MRAGWALQIPAVTRHPRRWPTSREVPPRRAPAIQQRIGTFQDRRAARAGQAPPTLETPRAGFAPPATSTR